MLFRRALAMALVCSWMTQAPAEPVSDGTPAAGLGFIENQGQFDPEVRFVVRSRGLIAQCTDNAIHWNLMSPSDPATPRPSFARTRKSGREREVTAPRFA